MRTPDREDARPPRATTPREPAAPTARRAPGGATRKLSSSAREQQVVDVEREEDEQRQQLLPLRDDGRLRVRLRVDQVGEAEADLDAGELPAELHAGEHELRDQAEEQRRSRSRRRRSPASVHSVGSALGDGAATTGASASARTSARPARTRSGTSRWPKTGAARARARRRAPAPAGTARGSGIAAHRSAHVVRQALEERGRVVDEPREHPRPEDRRAPATVAGDLRDERQRHLVDLRHAPGRR